MAYLSIDAVWADAVFVSRLQRRDELSVRQVRQAASAAVRAFGCAGCAGRVAQEFGDHPETAVTRMCWARAVAREVFGNPALEAGPGAAPRTWQVIGPLAPTEQRSGSPRAGQRQPSWSAAGGKG